MLLQMGVSSLHLMELIVIIVHIPCDSTSLASTCEKDTPLRVFREQ